MKDVIETIQAELPHADLMTPRYRSHITSNADPTEVAEALCKAIETVVDDRASRGRPYREIILIGFSLGGLVLRKAFVFARGEVQDSSTPGLRPNYAWDKLVTRIVLFGGVNRGWSMSPKPKRMPWTIWLMYRFLYPFGYLVPGGGLIHAFRRGTPFVANLRVQWQNLRSQTLPIPATIQMLGDLDDLVAREDNIDIQFCDNFVFLDVRNTGHSNAMNFHDPEMGAHRRRVFVRALTTNLDQLTGDLERPEFKSRTEQEVGAEGVPVTDVVFVIHGIRDTGLWTAKVRAQIDRLGKEHGRRIFVNTAAYTRFPMSGFLFRLFRQGKVRWFMDRYSEALARYPRASFHFIGHSNGTYLLANALECYAACRFDRVVFAGSVVPREYPWDRMIRAGRVRSIRNDLASKDWVVAIFPHLFQQVRDVLNLVGIRAPGGAIGSGGVYGFLDTGGNRHQIAFVDGTHGAAIDEQNHASLARYALGIDEAPKVDEKLKLATAMPGWLVLVSTFCAVIWFLLALIPFLASGAMTYGWYVWQSGGDWSAAGLLMWVVEMQWMPIYLPAIAVAALVGWLLCTA